jgi:hypothetical protein
MGESLHHMCSFFRKLPESLIRKVADSVDAASWRLPASLTQKVNNRKQKDDFCCTHFDSLWGDFLGE